MDEASVNTTPSIRQLLFLAMSNDFNKRPKDGHELVMYFNHAIYKRQHREKIFIIIFR